MTNQSIAAALTLGFLVFTLSILPVTTAEAECQTLSGKLPLSCPPGWESVAFNRIEDQGMIECCRVSTTTPPSRDPGFRLPQRQIRLCRKAVHRAACQKHRQGRHRHGGDIRGPQSR